MLLNQLSPLAILFLSRIFPEAHDGGDHVLFKEKLTGDILAIMVVPSAYASRLNNIDMLRYLTFTQQHSLRRHL